MVLVLLTACGTLLCKDGVFVSTGVSVEEIHTHCADCGLEAWFGLGLGWVIGIKELLGGARRLGTVEETMSGRNCIRPQGFKILGGNIIDLIAVAG